MVRPPTGRKERREGGTEGGREEGRREGGREGGREGEAREGGRKERGRGGGEEGGRINLSRVWEQHVNRHILNPETPEYHGFIQRAQPVPG
jgi:hypothetical protein